MLRQVLSPGHPLGLNAYAFGGCGALVKHTLTKKIGVLTCQHVITSNDPNTSKILSPLIENSPPIHIAELGPSLLNQDGDAAVGWLLPDIEYSPKNPLLKCSYTGVRRPKEGEILTKVGARTGLTRARVTHTGNYPTKYRHGVVSIDGFYLEPIDNQPKNQLICAPGDSGAIWFDEQTYEAVGLHFAGECNEFYGPVHAKACFISRVLNRLNVELL